MSVGTYLNDLSTNLNIAENEASKIDTSISTLQTRLNSYFGSEVKEKFRFGSFVRKTMLPRYADTYSDVDYMIVFDNSSNLKPQTFISQLKRFAQYYYSSSEIYQSHPTVALELNHIKFDLVPSYRSFWGLYIPAKSSSYEEWMYTEPFSLNSTLDTANATNGYRLKPLIRLVKYWNASEDYIYNSFELEQSLVGMSYYLCSNLKDYLCTAIDNLHSSRWNLPDYKKAKLERAKKIVDNVRYNEQNSMPYSAEEEIKKLFKK